MQWYLLHTRSSISERKLREVVEECAAVKEAYVPLHKHEYKTRTGAKHIQMCPVFPSTVFVYADYHPLRKFIIDRFIPCSFILGSDRNVHSPMVIPYGDMLIFRRICDNYPYKIEYLNNSFAKFENCDIVTIKNGPLAGVQGKLKEIRHDFKLIIGVGHLTIALSKIQDSNKFQIVVDCPVLKFTEQNKLYHLVDTCLAHLHCYGYVDDAPSKLRAILSQFDQGYDIDDCIDQFRSTDTKLSETLASITPAQKSDFATLAFNLKMRHNNLDLDTQIPSSPLRPFLTIEPGVKMKERDQQAIVEHDGFTELIIRKEITEPRITNDATGEYKSFTNRYYAHVGVLRSNDNTLRYVLNFHDFYEYYDNKEEQSKQRFHDKLSKFNANLFLQILEDREENKIHFSTITIGSQNLHCLCLNTNESDINYDSVTTLIDIGHNLCNEVIGNTHLRTWRTALCNVWLRK